MHCNAIPAFETGLAHRPSRLSVVCVNASGWVQVMSTVIDSLVDVANGVQAVVGRPVVAPYARMRKDIVLNDWNESGGIKVVNHFHKETVYS